jgi:hypothetical protein
MEAAGTLDHYLDMEKERAALKKSVIVRREGKDFAEGGVHTISSLYERDSFKTFRSSTAACSPHRYAFYNSA